MLHGMTLQRGGVLLFEGEVASRITSFQLQEAKLAPVRLYSSSFPPAELQHPDCIPPRELVHSFSLASLYHGTSAWPTAVLDVTCPMHPCVPPQPGASLHATTAQVSLS